MSDNDLIDDILLKNLCDDIYISIQTFTTIHGVMYVTSRFESQGSQRAYNVTSVPIRACNGIRRQNAHQFGEDDFIDDEDQDDTLNHHVSSSVTTPYRSTSQTQVMRSVSNNTNDFDQDNNEEFTLPV